MRNRYQQKAVPALMKRFGYKKSCRCRVSKRSCINMGMGAAIADAKLMDEAVACIRDISGQKPVVTAREKGDFQFQTARKCAHRLSR